MRNLKTIVLGAALLAAGSLSAATLTVEILGPGGHSNGNYGRTNAVHAAARAALAIEKAVPDAVITDVKGGVSVNAIAGDASFKVVLPQGDVKTLTKEVTEAVKAGCGSENAFRGIKPGDLTNGVPAGVRCTVK